MWCNLSKQREETLRARNTNRQLFLTTHNRFRHYLRQTVEFARQHVSVMLWMVPCISGPQGPCTAATDALKGPSMVSQTVLWCRRLFYTNPWCRRRFYTIIYTHKSVYGSQIERRLLEYVRGNRWTAKGRFQTNQQWKLHKPVTSRLRVIFVR